MKKISLLVLICVMGVLFLAGCGQQTSNNSTQAASIANPINKIYLNSANGAVDITWEATVSEANIAGYNIYRSTTSGSNYVKIATVKYGKVYWDCGANWTTNNLNQYQANTMEVAPLIYPNPCSFESSNIRIQYLLYRNSDVTLEVYNVHGEKIFQKEYSDALPEGFAGFNEIVWDGMKNDGTRIIQGIYPFRIISDALKLTSTEANIKGDYIVAAGTNVLTNDIPYYYVMTAFSTTGAESAYSSEEAVTPSSSAKNTIWETTLDSFGRITR